MYGGGQKGGNDEALMAALMAAAAQEEMKKRQTKYMEAVLPVALLVILALIFAVKLGFIDLSFLPFFNQPITVLILTDKASSVDIQNTLKVLQEQAFYYRIKTRTLSFSEGRRIYARQLADADVVMLYQVEKPVLSYLQRNEIAKYLAAGGKLIVVLDSGTELPKKELVRGQSASSSSGNEYIKVGWWGFSQYMPVECPLNRLGAEEQATEGQNNTPVCEKSSINDAEFSTVEPDHPILQGLETLPKVSSIEVIKDLQISRSGRDILDIYEGSIDNPKGVYPGITVSTGITGTKVVHFNYPPYVTPHIFIRTVLYLAGRAG